MKKVLYFSFTIIAIFQAIRVGAEDVPTYKYVDPKSYFVLIAKPAPFNKHPLLKPLIEAISSATGSNDLTGPGFSKVETFTCTATENHGGLGVAERINLITEAKDKATSEFFFKSITTKEQFQEKSVDGVTFKFKPGKPPKRKIVDPTAILPELKDVGSQVLYRLDSHTALLSIDADNIDIVSKLPNGETASNAQPAWYRKLNTQNYQPLVFVFNMIRLRELIPLAKERDQRITSISILALSLFELTDTIIITLDDAEKPIVTLSANCPNEEKAGEFSNSFKKNLTKLLPDFGPSNSGQENQAAKSKSILTAATNSIDAAKIQQIKSDVVISFEITPDLVSGLCDVLGKVQNKATIESK